MFSSPWFMSMPPTQTELVLPPCSLQQLPPMPTPRDPTSCLLPAAAHIDTHAELPLLSLSPWQRAEIISCPLQELSPPCTCMCTASPDTLLPTGIHVGVHIQQECSHPFSYSPSPIDTLAQSWSSPCTPMCKPMLPPHSLLCLTHSQRSHPFLHSDSFMQAHMHTHTTSALPGSPWQFLPPTPGVSTHSLLHRVIN